MATPEESCRRSYERALEGAIGFFAVQGVTLSYRPRIGFLEEAECLRKNIQARAVVENGVPAGQPSLSHIFRYTTSVILWRHECGLSVSLPALRELHRAAGIRKTPRTENVANILVAPYGGGIDYDTLVAHELWHLIEDERGLLSAGLLIREGTATYASARYLGVEGRGAHLLSPPEECGDPFRLKRAGVGYLAHLHLHDERNPLLAMLDPAVRAELSGMALERCAPLARRLARFAATKQWYVDDFRKYLQRILRDARHDPPGIITAFRDLGAETLAEELARQELAGLVSFISERGSSAVTRAVDALQHAL